MRDGRLRKGSGWSILITRMLRRDFQCLLAALGAACASSAQSTERLRNLRPQHPRLLITEEMLERTRALLTEDERARVLLSRLRSRGEALLREDPVQYRLIGPRLLTQSRYCVERAYVLGALYLLEPSSRWLDGLRNNLRSAANFPDWNPSHFLDVAEMTHAFAIAYDWLHDAWTADDRRVIRQAILEKGLRAGIATGYEGGPDGGPARWAKATNNWNQVCNGGMVLGALAIAESEPALAEKILAAALRSLPAAMKEFAPDGGWYEGVAYWQYTLRYAVPLLAALETALGNRFGIDEARGFSETGDFYLHATGPTGLFFNFSDCSRQRDKGFPWLHWMARRFERPLWHWAASANASGEHPLSLFWYEPNPLSPRDATTPRDRVFLGMHAAFMRSSWTSPRASFAGFYAGHNGVSHSQLEMGTFVFDAMGERWAEELGVDDYDLPGYFGGRRWDYYRLNSHGQNVPLFDGKGQQVPARGIITSSGADNGSVHAIADLSPGYAEIAHSVRRGIRLMEDRRVLLIQDEFALKKPAVYQWQMHTMAEVKVDIDRALLIHGDKMVEVRGLARTSLDFIQETPRPATLAGGNGKTERDNSEYRKLVIRTRQPVERGTVTVVLTPLENPNAPRGASFIRPLDAWD